MYFRGAYKGTLAGINAAVIFMILEGRRKEADDFIGFINNITSNNLKIDLDK